MEEYQEDRLEVFCTTESVLSMCSYLFCILKESLTGDKISQKGDSSLCLTLWTKF